MKTIKIPQDLLPPQAGQDRGVFWCIYNNVPLNVNDKVLVFAENTGNSNNEKTPLHTVKIDVVIIKRLGDIKDSELAVPYRFTSRKEMMSKLQHVYGRGVDSNTPVTIISYSKHSEGVSIIDNQLRMAEAKLYADGGSRGNPGPSASGFVIASLNDEIVVRKGTYLGITTNNQAEYQSLKFGLEEALRLGIKTLHVYMDSLLVINQMLGIFKVKNRDLWPIYESVKFLTQRFKHVSFTHVPRELNKEADAAVNLALDKALE